jgi:3'-5' exoribonuclease
MNVVENKRFVTELKENETFSGSFLVKAKTLGNTRSGNPFLRIRLADRSGETEGRIWERALELAGEFQVNDVVRLRAKVERYQGELQLNISDLKRLDPTEVDATLYLPTGPKDPEDQWLRLNDLAAQVKNSYLKRLLRSFFTDVDFVGKMKQSPAAKVMHHAYLGGLLEHTVSVTRLLGRICDHYPRLNRDLLVTGAILHDIGKLDEFSYHLQVDYTDAGRLLGHVVLGVQRVQEKINKIKGFPPDLALALQHLMVSHHGEYEFGSPKRPKTLEAFALNSADDLDAKMNHVSKLLDAEDENASRWTPYQRVYGRYFFKGGTEEKKDAGIEAVGKKEEAESQNYSLLDLLIPEGKEEER